MGIVIQSRPFGKIEVDEKQIISFPDGILGFEFVKKFVILDSAEKTPFKWMQAYSEPDLAFVIIRPEDFMEKYDPSISQADLDALEAKSSDKLVIFSIVTIPANPSCMTANLQGPIVINTKKRIGRQIISMDERYKVKHKILDELKKRS